MSRVGVNSHCWLHSIPSSHASQAALTSQRAPSNPSAQWHWNPGSAVIGRHVPWFKQVSSAHRYFSHLFPPYPALHSHLCPPSPAGTHFPFLAQVFAVHTASAHRSPVWVMGQAHRGRAGTVVVESWHCPLLRQAYLWQGSHWHWSPVKPGLQSHWATPLIGLHLPPFTQDFWVQTFSWQVAPLNSGEHLQTAFPAVGMHFPWFLQWLSGQTLVWQ